MSELSNNTLRFSVMLYGNAFFKHFRCKIKLYNHGFGTIISAEAVNAPYKNLEIYINKTNVLELTATENGYGFCAVFLPFSPAMLCDCEFTVLHNGVAVSSK